jgi:hypothetical protein
MEDFLEADERRLHSREVDFGLLWRPSGSPVTHRASWIEATGELYLVQSGPTGSGGGHVELLAVTDREGVERALEGWEPASRRPGGLAWLRKRVTGLRGLGTPATGMPGR